MTKHFVIIWLLSFILIQEFEIESHILSIKDFANKISRKILKFKIYTLFNKNIVYYLIYFIRVNKIITISRYLELYYDILSYISRFCSYYNIIIIF